LPLQNREQFPRENRERRKMPRRIDAARVYESEGKKPFPIWTIPAVITCIAVLSVLIYFLSGEYERYEGYRAMVSRVNVETFYEGIAINGVDIGGMTMEEAAAAVGEGETQSQQDFAVVIESGDKRWRISSQEVPLRFDTQEVLRRAYALGRSGTLAQRDAAVARLKSEGASFETRMGYDKEKVRELTDIVASRLSRAAVDAQLYAFETATRTFTFTSEAQGYQVDADQLYRDVVAALDAGDYDAVVTPQGQATQPTITRDMLSSMFGRIASFSTETTKDKNRNTNISLSAQAINGRMVAPGETLSFNECTGERTSDKGYREAGAISGGVLIDATGGGVCQTSSTLFNAVVRADLEIVDRTEHSWPSTYVPKGEDAAVDWPRLDFKFKNNKDTPVFIMADYADQLLTVEVYGRLLEPGVSIELSSDLIRTLKPSDEVLYVQDSSLPVGTSKAGRKKRTGYVVDTYKVYYKDGVETERALLWRTTYKSSQKEILYN
jgi:vancomycin resistance protein YoaR